LEEGVAAARTCFNYLKPGGYLRIAVPDGLNPNPEYIEWIRVGGASPGQHRNGHKVLYTYETLSDVLSQAGFRVVLYEYFDHSGRFHFQEWSREQGTIQRSKRYDRRNADGQLRFTSIVADAFKP
jgi:predicted SAM-dependent methyltransferase